MSTPRTPSLLTPSLLTHAWQTAHGQWQARPLRERRMATLLAALLAAAALWQWTLAPALAVWQQAPQRQAHMDQQGQRMRQLQTQAQALQAAQPMSRAAAVELLHSQTRQWLGTGSALQVQGDTLHVSLKNTPGDALAQWLAQARTQAQATVVQAALQASPTAPDPAAASLRGAMPDFAPAPAPAKSSNPAAAPALLWHGSLTLRLP